MVLHDDHDWYNCIKKRSEAQAPKKPCDKDCFLLKIKTDALQSLTSPKPINGRKRKREKQEPLNPDHLMYHDSDTESSSGEEGEVGTNVLPPSTSAPQSEAGIKFKPKKQKRGNRYGKFVNSPTPVYKNTSGQRWRGKAKMKQEIDLPDQEADEDVLPEGWNGQEVTMFRMLHPIFGHNYCAIAGIISSKTCHQVIEYH